MKKKKRMKTFVIIVLCLLVLGVGTVLFAKSIETLSVPILFVGSLQDEMCRKDMLEEYTEMNNLITNGKIHIFDAGGHPTVATNAEQFAKIALKFIYG